MAVISEQVLLLSLIRETVISILQSSVEIADKISFFDFVILPFHTLRGLFVWFFHFYAIVTDCVVCSIVFYPEPVVGVSE